MTKNTELRAALLNILTLLDSEPKSAAEWRAIRDDLGDAHGYASTCVKMRERLEKATHESAYAVIEYERRESAAVLDASDAERAERFAEREHRKGRS